MTRHLPVAHLSDEAIAAVADGVLVGAPLARAERHLGSCLDCAQEVVAQRQASFALRAASIPCLPGDLADRLRGLPHTISLEAPDIVCSVLGDNGQPMFAAFGTPGGSSLGASAEPAGRSTPRRRLGR